ncbi:hypothetical protein GBAR_LOCUS30798 [Geodia barretti]|uniref:Uncharacterized protein n=3 Tax=Geodia barretti TaxID=519541 RepID=A0AA35TXW3_GEOBA|nr:hypothetical protein GBAR_LOCUS30798 [Geodia barretti]
MVMGGSSVITTPGTQTQYSLTVTSQDYDITVRADTCDGSLTGDTSSVYKINLTGNLTSCSALYMYNPVDGSLRAIEVNWTPISRNNPGGPEYTVVIDDGVGSRVRERVGAVNCSSTQCSHTYYPAAGSRGEFGVSVETAGCVTRQTVCLERPVYCSLGDLCPSLVEENRVCGSVSGGGVCYSGDSVGSVAVYFCDDGYSLEGDTTRECLSSGLWNGTTPQCVEIINECKPEESPEKDDSQTTTVVASIVCSLVFLTIGVLLGVVGLYLIQRVRGRSSGPTSSSPPPLPPPVTYEEVGVAREVKSSQDIQLTSNEAYGPINKDNIPTSRNTAYGQVQL